MTPPTIAEVKEVLNKHALYDDCYSTCIAATMDDRLDDSMVIVTRDSLAMGLIGSGLMRRYRDYANSLPTMTGIETPNELAEAWAAAVIDAIKGETT
jgi:hypothetical protein